MTDTIAATLNQLTLGEPQVFQNLAVFPLVSTADAEPVYLTLDEALKAGRSRVTEVSVHLSVLEVPALGGHVESASSRAQRVARRRTSR